MAKMTIAGLKSAMATYVAAAKQAGTWSATTNNVTGMLDKIGKQVTIVGNFQDKLPELDGDDLPLGKTIEEYMISLVLPQAFTAPTDGNAYGPTYHAPVFESVAYNYTLGREKVSISEPYDNFERACISPEVAGNVGASIMESLTNSKSLTRYAEKKQLLGNAADKAVTASLVGTVAVPVDDTTGEAFLKQIKKDIEDASFAHEGGLGGALIGAAPELILYIKKGVMPSLEVDTFAGAFNREDLALPCRIKVVDDFGTMTNSTVFAILVDPRGIKLHTGYNAVRSEASGEYDFVTVTNHFEDTGFISKYCFIKAYKPS